MTFTDEDLQRLKDWTRRPSPFDYAILPEKILALIARLEAAEKALHYVFANDGKANGHELFEAWRKAAGK